MAGRQFEDFCWVANTFHVLPSTMTYGLSGLAKYNLDHACALYILISKGKAEEEAKKESANKFGKKGNNKPSINFGMMDNK